MTESNPSSATGTTTAARDHARAQAGTSARFSRTVPPSLAAELPDGVAAEDVIWDEVVEPGNYTVGLLPRGARLRLCDLDGDACVQFLAFNAGATAERLNVADTVKVQWQAYLGAGQLLLSDMGRVLMSILSDSAAGHDTFNGISNRAWNEQRFGSGAVHGPCPNSRDRFAVALTKAGLGRRDIAPAVNLFKSVVVESDGSFTWHGQESPVGAEMVLRADMDVLVAMTLTPHVLDPRDEWAVGPLGVTAWTGPPAHVDDPVRNATPEGRRAFENTEAWIASRPQEASVGPASIGASS